MSKKAKRAAERRAGADDDLASAFAGDSSSNAPVRGRPQRRGAGGGGGGGGHGAAAGPAFRFSPLQQELRQWAIFVLSWAVFLWLIFNIPVWLAINGYIHPWRPAMWFLGTFHNLHPSTREKGIESWLGPHGLVLYAPQFRDQGLNFVDRYVVSAALNCLPSN